MSVKGAIKSIFRILLYIFLTTLPFNFQAYLAGILFAKYHNDQISKGIELYMHEVDQVSWMDQWFVPGAPSICDFQDNAYPFFLPQLRSGDWYEKLGLTIPYAHQESFALAAPINQHVAFDGAVRDMRRHAGMPTEYWIYVSSISMPEVYDWDKAFVQLLEYHEMHPLPNMTALKYVDCGTAPFLCHVWQVQYPALVHFKIDENGTVGDDVDPEAFQAPLSRLRPVEVRILDLGLQQEVSPLRPGVFPTMLNQMKALTALDGAYTIEEPYNELMRAYHQFHYLHFAPACDRPGSFLDYTSSFENFLRDHIAKPLGLEEAAEISFVTAFSASLILGHLFYLVANPISNFWSGFFGGPTEWDHLAERLEDRAGVVENGGVFGDMHGGFIDMLEGLVLSSAAESAEQPMVTTQSDVVKSLFAGLRANVSSIWKGV